MNKKRILTLVLQLGGIALLVYVDYLLKELAVRSLSDGPVVLIPNVLGLRLTQNTGAAFSMFSSSTTVLSICTGIALAIIMIVMTLIKNKPRIYDVLVPLIVAGGAGNLLDRIRQGYVIDYIETLFIRFPIFNFADILITCSCIALIIYLIYEMIRDRKKETETQAKEKETEL